MFTLNDRIEIGTNSNRGPIKSQGFIVCSAVAARRPVARKQYPSEWSEALSACHQNSPVVLFFRPFPLEASSGVQYQPEQEPAAGSLCL